MAKSDRLPGIVYSDPVQTRVLRMSASLWGFLDARKKVTRKSVQTQLRELVEAERTRVNRANLERA